MKLISFNIYALRFAPLVLVLVSAVVAVAAYLQALDFPFIYDDTVYLTDNTRLLGLHFTELWRLFIEPYNDFSEFLPLRDLSYWFDINLFGLNSAAFRIHNIVLYLLCLPLVYANTSGVWRYFRPTDTASAPWVAAVVTALFALQPSHAEAVVWISGRKDVLSTLFSLLSLWFAINAKREQGLSSPHAAAALLALLAAMLSKASAFAVAPVIAMLWFMFWRDIPLKSRSYFLLLWPIVSLFMAVCIALTFATIITARVPFYFGVEAVTRSLAVLGWLARLAVSPESRHFFYPVLEEPGLPVMVALGVGILAATAVSVVVTLRNKKLSVVGFALVVFLLLCTPSIQLIPYMPPSLASDRWLSLAVWPVILLIVTAAWNLKPVPRTVLLLMVALSWSYQTYERPRDFRNFEALIDSDIRAYPGYYMPAIYKIKMFQVPVGSYREAFDTANKVTSPEARNIMIKLIQGYAITVDSVSNGNPDAAMASLMDLGEALKQTPARADWDTSMLNFWGESQKMLADLLGYLAKNFPEDASIQYNAGLWMLGVHNDEAIDHLRAAAESQRLPINLRGAAFKYFGLALINLGYVAEAEAPLRAALEQSPPDLQAYCLLSGVYGQTGRIEEASRAEADCRSRVPHE